MESGSVTIDGVGSTEVPRGWSWHPMGLWAEYIETAPPGTRINLGDPLERCAKCLRLWRPDKEEHVHADV